LFNRVFFPKPPRLRNDAHGAPLAVLLQPKTRNPSQTIASTSPSVPVAMQPPCQSRKSGFGSWHQWPVGDENRHHGTRSHTSPMQGPAGARQEVSHREIRLRVLRVRASPPQLQHYPVRRDQKFDEAPRLALRIWHILPLAPYKQGPARRSTIAKFDYPFCVYVLRPPNPSTSQFVAIRNSTKPPICIWHSASGWHILPLARALSKGPPGPGDPSRNSTNRFCVYVLYPPLSIINNSDPN
jgi:hypothetical protein